MTLAELVREAARRIGGPDARAEAEILAARAFGLSRAQLIAHGNGAAEPNGAQRLLQWADRRAEGWPIAYLTGTRGFWSLELEVTPAVLIPRPETELLVECALARLPADREGRAADLGTGSGAIALALVRERPRLHVVATDRSEDALTVARRNAARLGIDTVEFRMGDWLAALRDERFDAIVSNPPYVAAGDLHLAQGDLRFEPRAALASGADGLEAIRRIVAEAPMHLVPGGWLVLEHGYDQGERVRALLGAAGLAEVFTARDLAGHERVSGGRALS